jgi:NTP pyrophosphatase (non-canonical NTP hydrolase)
MDFKTYIQHCKKTESVLPDSMRLDTESIYRCLKIAEGSSNLVDLLKKRIFYGRETHKDGQSMSTHMTLQAQSVQHFSEMLVEEGSPYIADEESKVNLRYMHGVVGLYTETGELIESLRKAMLDPEKFDRTNLLEELGDCLWYIGILCDTFDFDFNEILERNVAKLTTRYGESFSAERANNRDLEAELKVLNSNDHYTRDI